MKKSLLGIALLSLVISSSSIAEAFPTGVGFSGRFADENGPVNGEVDIELSLVNEIGATVWSNTYNVDAQEGLIFIKLDNEVQSVFNGDALSLQVIVNGNKLDPGLPILSVPYAHRSAVANQLGDIHPEDVVTTEIFDAFASDVVKKNELDIFADKDTHVSDDELNGILSDYAQVNQCVTPAGMNSTLSQYAKKDQNTTFTGDLNANGKFRVAGNCNPGDVLTFNGDSIKCAAPPKIECNWYGEKFVSDVWNGPGSSLHRFKVYCEAGKITRLQNI